MGLDFNFAAQLVLNACFLELTLVQHLKIVMNPLCLRRRPVTNANLESNNELAFLLASKVNVAKLPLSETSPNVKIRQLKISCARQPEPKVRIPLRAPASGV